MAYNRRLLNYIKSNFDYESYLDVNIDYKHTGDPSEIRICCPFCSEDDYKCYVNTDRNLFCCFKCDTSNQNADVFDFIAACENITVREAIERTVHEYREVTPEDLSIYDGEDALDLERDSLLFKTVPKLESLPVMAKPLSENTEDSKRYYDYLISRGFTKQDLLDCQVHYVPNMYCPVKNPNNGNRVNIGKRILFPIYGGSNYLVSWLARTLDSSQKQKYINAPGTELSRTVWPFVPPKGNTAVVVEGLIDALSIRRSGYSAYATFGKKLSEYQIDILKYWEVKNLVIFLDNNAKKEMVKAVDTLKLQFNISVVDVSKWPKDSEGKIVDSGFFLAKADGVDILKATLDKRINVTNEWEYVRWQMQ